MRRIISSLVGLAILGAPVVALADDAPAKTEKPAKEKKAKKAKASKKKDEKPAEDKK
jgi:hypothetical protein